jgi:hypothetical protein
LCKIIHSRKDAKEQRETQKKNLRLNNLGLCEEIITQRCKGAKGKAAEEEEEEFAT